MLISFREAADLSFQIAIAVTLVISGAALMTMTGKSRAKPLPALDVSRPNLWEAGPVRLDRKEQLLFTVAKPRTKNGLAASALCSDAIGLRIACDLVAINRRPS